MKKLIYLIIVLVLIGGCDMGKWNPDGKITDFGVDYLAMEIPDTTTSVLGEADPGGTPVAIGSMGETAAFVALLANNVQYVKKRMLTENITYVITNSTQIAALQTDLDEIGYIDKNVTLQINFTNNVLGGGNYPIKFEHISGGGEIVVDGSYLAQNGLASDGVFQITNCSVNRIKIQNLDMENTASTDPVISIYESNSIINIDSLQIDAYTGGQGLSLIKSPNVFVNGVVFAGAPVGLYQIFMISSKLEIIPPTSGEMFTLASGAFIFAQRSSRITITELNDNMVGYGGGACNTPLVFDDSVELVVGTIDDYSFADTGASNVIPDVLRYMAFFPKNLNDDVVLTLPPNNAMNDSTLPLKIENFYGSGSIVIIGNTYNAAYHETQDSVIIANSNNGILIKDNKIRIGIESLKVDTTGGGNSCIRAEDNSMPVNLRYNYFDCSASPIVWYTETNGHISDNSFNNGTNGIVAGKNSKMLSHNNQNTGGGTLPTLYGLRALDNGTIGKSSTQPSGTTGNEEEVTGGDIRP